MLWQRILTALVLVPLVIGSVLLLDSLYFSLLLAVVILWGALEWAKLAGIPSCSVRILYLAAVAVGLWCAAALVQQGDGGFWLLVIALGWWITVVFRLLRFRPPDRPDPGVSPARLVDGLMTLVPAWMALVALHRWPEQGPGMVLFLLILVWVADSGAYFAGRRWGRVKLAPHISPGKTREGVAGALAGAAVCALGMSMVQKYGVADTLVFVSLCMLTTVFSVVGDLFESLAKRRRGVKDSGNVLPGHGGILDRIDSLTAAAPIFVLGLDVGGGLG